MPWPAALDYAVEDPWREQLDRDGPTDARLGLSQTQMELENDKMTLEYNLSDIPNPTQSKTAKIAVNTKTLQQSEPSTRQDKIAATKKVLKQSSPAQAKSKEKGRKLQLQSTMRNRKNGINQKKTLKRKIIDQEAKEVKKSNRYDSLSSDEELNEEQEAPRNDFHTRKQKIPPIIQPESNVNWKKLEKHT
ncbi:hypothetical protein X975_06821, partial [Stegodyphus mimosarum]